MNYEDEHLALQQLFYKETKLLQTIDRLHVAANRERKNEKVIGDLMKMSEPKQWDLSNGKKVLVHTPLTTRAKQLSQLYIAASTPLLTLAERLDVLLHIKWIAKEFDCDLTRNLVDLIDREADLLNRCVTVRHYPGLNMIWTTHLCCNPWGKYLASMSYPCRRRGKLCCFFSFFTTHWSLFQN